MSIIASPITDGIDGLLQGGKGLLSSPTVAAITGGIVGGVVGLGTGLALESKTNSNRGNSRRKSKKPPKRKKRKRYTPHTAGKGKDRSTKRIRHTKNGQPYIILANGRAKFIKKSSARSSRKRKGGRY